MASRKTFRIFIIMVIAAAVVVSAAAVYKVLQRKQAEKKADRVLESMKMMIPGLGVETDSDPGDGRDPLSVMNIDNIDIVGCLEIPSINVMIPVTTKADAGNGFAAYKSGSPVKGALMLTGSRHGVFQDITKLEPGSKAAFTDVDGTRYRYRVITQFHLKKWDKADYDMMLCYKTDEDTWFVTGLKRE